MSNRTGQGGPAGSAPKSHRNQGLERELAERDRRRISALSRAALDRELEDLERRKLATLAGGRIRLTRAGYQELARRFPRGRS